MLVLECASCGAQYPADLKKKWGRTQETAGYGPSPVCVALVPQSQDPDDKDGPREVCTGVLAAIEADSAERVTALTPIGSNEQ